MKHKITEVQIQIVKPKDGLIGFASIVLDEELYIGSIGIHKKLNTDGFRLTYPTKALSNGQQIHIVHPVNKRLSKLIEKAVFTKLKEVMRSVYDRHSSFNNTDY